MIVVIVVAGAAAAIVISGDDDEKKDYKIDTKLEIYGNADGDDDIDSEDVELISQWIDAVKSDDADRQNELKKTINLDFADAKHDGTIDSDDVVQTKAIADGTATHLWFMDGIGKDRDMDIGESITRVGCEYFTGVETMLILGQTDRIAAVDFAPWQYLDFYFSDEEKKNISNLGNMNAPDYDAVNKLNLDVLLIFSASASYEAKQEKLVGTDVLYLGLYNPDLINTQSSSFVQGILKAGYIFGAVEKAEAYTEWILNYRDKMLEIEGSIPESEKPVVLMSNYTVSYFSTGKGDQVPAYSLNDPLGQAIALAGGVNILDEINPSYGSAYSVKINLDKLFTKEGTVDYICLHNVKYTYNGATMADTPAHGYLQDDDKEFRNAIDNALGQKFVTTETVVMLAGDFRNGCTGGILLAAYLGNLINPELYSSIDPIAMHNEYVEFLGISGYDVKEHGVFFEYGNNATS